MQIVNKKIFYINTCESQFYPKRIQYTTFEISISAVCMFPGNQTEDPGVASTMLYCLNHSNMWYILAGIIQFIPSNAL